MIDYGKNLYSEKHLILIQETLSSLSKSEKKELLKELETAKPANTKIEYTENAYKAELVKFLNSED